MQTNTVILLFEVMIQFIFIVTIILSLLSQLPAVLESGLDAYFKLSWIPLSLVTCVKYPLSIFNKHTLFFCIVLVIFGLYCLIMQTFTGNTYLKSGADYYNILISFMVFINSYIIWHYKGSMQLYKTIITTLLIGSIILSFFVYRDFLSTADFGSKIYAYNAKNSLGQILFACGLIAFVAIKIFKTKHSRWLILGFIGYLLVIIMLLKSRATIICVFFAAVYYLIRYGSMKQRLAVSITILCGVIFILSNDSAYEIIVKNIIFANRNAGSIESLSSGRSRLVLDALYIINNNIIFGVGNKYVDCMPICIWMQYGIIGFSIIFSFLAILAYKIIKLNKSNPIFLTTYLLFWSYMINSLFEAYPPFGPGVKCFPLWLMIGISFSICQRQHSKSNLLS